jgi:succinate dehydrogenase/fumarate reductase iron-sulfur protein
MESVKFRIARHDPETGSGSWSEHQVELREKTTILDCLHLIQRTDPSLGFRYACRVGMCGSCSMVVNGRDRWTCRTRVRSLGASEITLEPLRNMPVIRDLAVDFTPLWEKYRQIEPALNPAPNPKPLLKAEIRRQRQLIENNMQCINCGACYSSCGFVARDPLYLGPHALNRAFTVMEDPRDGSAEERLRIIDNEHGCWKCHVQMNCTEVCPMELSPSAAIQHLKRAILRKRVLSPGRRMFAYTAIGAAIAGVAGFVLYEPKEWVSVGPEALVPQIGFLVFNHGDKRAFLRRKAGGEIEAISERCSHRGCRVNWDEPTGEFQCPCHKGVFDREGVPISGPPQRPLDRYPTRMGSAGIEVFF